MTYRMTASNFAENRPFGESHMIKFLPALALVAAVLSACASSAVTISPVRLSQANIADIQGKAAYNLKDPNSAQFRNVRAVDKEFSNGRKVTLVCGEINARNSFGGYVGFSNFLGTLENGSFVLIGVASPDTDWLYRGGCS